MVAFGKVEADEVPVRELPRYADEYLAYPRLGQGSFRVQVTEAP